MDPKTKKSRIRRKRYLISRRIQLKYVGLILLFMFLTGALCSYVVYYSGMLMMGERLANIYPQGRFIAIVKLVNLRILMSLILVSPMVAVIGLFVSHKIAGPLYRIERYVTDMASGDFSTRLILRKQDELKGLADKVNGLVDSLKTTINDQKVHLTTAVKEISDMKKSLSSKPQDLSGVNISLDKIEYELHSIGKSLNKYILQ